MTLQMGRTLVMHTLVTLWGLTVGPDTPQVHLNYTKQALYPLLVLRHTQADNETHGSAVGRQRGRGRE